MAGFCGTGSGNFPQPGDPDLNNSVLSASPAFGGIDVSWTYPGLNPQAVAYTILYRSTNADPATMVRHRTVSGDYFYDRSTAPTPVEYFYWIQIVSVNDTIGDLIGPASAIAKPTIQDVLLGLTEKIDSGVLAQSLKTELARIDALNLALLSETGARVDAYDVLAQALGEMQADVDGIATLIAEETLVRENGDSAFVSQLNAIGAKANGNQVLITNEQIARADADTALGQRIDAISASNVNTFYQPTAPDPGTVTIVEGDLWVDTDDSPDYPTYQWISGSWQPTNDANLAGAYAAIESEKLARIDQDDALAQEITTLETTLGQKSQVFFQDLAPPLANVNDLWIDTDNNNQLYRWDGSLWVDGWDQRIVQINQDLADAQQAALDALNVAQSAQATADNAIRTFYQATAPTGLNNTTHIGDLWFDTDDDQAYRWTGSQWNLIQDNAIATALAAAQSAQTTADGKITAFYQGTQPTAEGVGDLWFNTSNKNRPYQWNGSVWADIRDPDIAVGVGRNQVFRQPTQPTASNIGDLWFDSDDGDKGYRWTGSSWVVLNLYTGNQVTAAIEDNNISMVGYCQIGGTANGSYKTVAACTAAGGTWVPSAPFAEAVKKVQVSDGAFMGTIEQRMSAYRNNLGALGALWSAKVSVSDPDSGEQLIGGFGIYNDGTEVEAGFDVDRFWIGRTGPDKVKPFIVEGGVVYINEAVIKEITFDKLRSADGTLMFTPGVYDVQGELISGGKLKAENIDADNLRVAVAAKFDGDVQSGNYSSSQGWFIGQNGYVKFNNADIRGRVDSASITTGSAYVGTLEIEGDAVIVPTSVQGGSVGGNGGFQRLWRGSVYLNTSGRIAVWWSVEHTYFSNSSWMFYINRNGARVAGRTNSWMGAKNDFPSGHYVSPVLPSGNHTFEFYWFGPDANIYATGNGLLLGVKR